MCDEHDSAVSCVEAGNEFMFQEDWASATHAFRAAVQLDPNLVRAYAGLGAALGNQGLWTLSAEAHTRALALAPDDVDTARVSLSSWVDVR